MYIIKQTLSVLTALYRSAVTLPSNYNKKCFFSNLLTACVHTEPNTFVLFVLYVDYIEEKNPSHRAYADSYTVITK